MSLPGEVQDSVFSEIVIPHKCPVCRKCWLVVYGRNAGKCVYGGPYRGYLELRELVKDSKGQ